MHYCHLVSERKFENLLNIQFLSLLQWISLSDSIRIILRSVRQLSTNAVFHWGEFPSRKYRSIEVGSRIFKWETRNSVSTSTSDLEIRVGKYEFPSAVECSISLLMRLDDTTFQERDYSKCAVLRKS